MKLSTWLVIEGKENRYGNVEYRIARTRRRRPINEVAVHLTLEVDLAALHPKIEAAIDARNLVLDLDVSSWDEE